MLWAADDPGIAALTDPTFWVNLGAAGVVLGLFIAGRLHSPKELARVEQSNATALDELRRQHDAAMKAQKEAHEAAMQRMDDHVRQLIVERDRANAERNEAIGVMRDFTMMAGAVLNQQPPWGQPPRRRGGEKQ